VRLAGEHFGLDVGNGSQLYAGADNGFYVFGASSDITQCSGNANNCGTPKQLLSGTSVNGVAVDGLGHVYLVTVSGGFLYRYNVAAGTFTQVDAGLLIEKGHISTLGFDKDGNLWIGEQPVADLPNGGRVRVYLAADLAALP
jgi:ligand-binding sensor domain-containing protein